MEASHVLQGSDPASELHRHKGIRATNDTPCPFVSLIYNEKVGKLQTQSKVHVADRYNEHFKYKAGDPGFVVCNSDGRGKRAT
jgi:hypothetical protein